MTAAIRDAFRFRVGAAWVGFAMAALIGCGGPAAPPPPVDTGARAAAAAHADALVRRDWAAAFASLDPESRRTWPEPRFANAADAFRRNLGFEPLKARVKSCDERNDEATAHVVFAGATSHHRFQQGFLMKRIDGAWRIVVPGNFGKT